MSSLTGWRVAEHCSRVDTAIERERLTAATRAQTQHKHKHKWTHAAQNDVCALELIDSYSSNSARTGGRPDLFSSPRVGRLLSSLLFISFHFCSVRLEFSSVETREAPFGGVHFETLPSRSVPGAARREAKRSTTRHAATATR